ncbi:hypothetical protein PROFUN_07119 [Planoprotostelium fungivorum]|uniref:Uncharacterized protein n=1 Tax=Planoprotostelium fungivorum TaxID=1890364 RepID=A0A2P6NMM5_9EUKA|nr:hypothetical protein PROFUN_07119 [Planoprotostelium fungivorum]
MRKDKKDDKSKDGLLNSVPDEEQDQPEREFRLEMPTRTLSRGNLKSNNGAGPAIQNEISIPIEVEAEEAVEEVEVKPSAASLWFNNKGNSFLSLFPKREYYRTRPFKNVVKSVVAYLLCTLCTFITPVAQTLGEFNFLASAAMIFVDMDLSMGGIFERFWISVLVMGVTFICSWGTLVTYQSSGIIMLTWIVSFTFCMSWMRAKFNVRWTSPISNALEVFFLTVIVGHRNMLKRDFEFSTFVLPFGLATIVGVIICLVVTAVVFPFSSTQLLQRELVTTFININKLLELNIRCFALEATPKEIQDVGTARNAVDTNSTKLANYLHDAKMEISRSYFSNDQKKKFIFLVRQLLVQSTAMTSCFTKDTKNTRKNDVLRNFVIAVTPSIKSLVVVCQRAAELLTDFFDSDGSDFEPQVWSDILAELDKEAEVLREVTSEAAETMSSISPVILSAKGHKRIRSFGNLENLEMETLLQGQQQAQQEDEMTQQSNASWEAIFRVNFFVASCDRLTVDFQKVLKYMLDLQKENMGRKRIQLPIWLSKFRKPKDKNAKRVDETESAPLSSNMEYRDNRAKDLDSRRIRRSQSLADSLQESLTESDAEEASKSLRARLRKMPSSAAIVGEQTRENSKTLGYRIWTITTFFTHTNEVVFAFKTALAIYLAALLFFLPQTQAFWDNIRAEWTLFTITALTSMTVGGNTLPSLYRVGGTIVGALWAVASWTIFPGNRLGLLFMSTLFAWPMFHMKLNTAYPRVGSVGLTTYIIILYGKYNGFVNFKKVSSEGQEITDSIEALAIKRSFCILFGILMVFLINRFVMPHLARKDLRIMISKTLHLTSEVFGLVTSQFLQKDKDSKGLKTASQLAQKIQMHISEEKALIAAAINEPRLKGPFPYKLYVEYVSSLQFLLDRILTLKLIIAGDFSPDVRKNIINPLNGMRKEMTTNIFMLLWIMAEAVRSKTPMPQHLPNAMKARNELISAFQKLPTVQLGEIREEQVEDYLLFCAYVESQKDLIIEIHKMVGLVKEEKYFLSYYDTCLSNKHRPIEKMQRARLLFLVVLWTAIVADDCFFLDSCNATLASVESLPTATSSLIFQSLKTDELPINLGSLAVKDITIRDSRLTWEQSNVSSISFAVRGSSLELIDSKILVQQDFSVNLDSDAPYSSIELSNSTLISNTSSFHRAQILFSGDNQPNTISSTFTRFTKGNLDIGSDIVWNGHLDVSSSFLRVIGGGFQISSQLSTTSWTIHNSTLMDAVLTFQFPITMEEVKSSSPGSSTIDFASGASIVNSSIDYLYHCNGCNVSNSILFKIPVRSTLRLSGLIQLLAQSCVSTTIEGSPGLVMRSTSRIDIIGSTLIGNMTWYAPRIFLSSTEIGKPSTHAMTSDESSGSFHADTIQIFDCAIEGSWSFIGQESTISQVTGSSSIHLAGHWSRFYSVHAKHLIMDEIDVSTDANIDVDQLTIGRLIISNSLDFITLGPSTSYTILRLFLRVIDLENSLKPVRGGIPTRFFGKLESKSDCSESTGNSSVLVSHDSTALYVTYVPPPPAVTYGWSDGVHTYIRLSAQDQSTSHCTDDLLFYHDLLVVDERGRSRTITSKDLSKPLGDTDYTYKFEALSDEDSCTRKRLTIHLKQKEGEAVTEEREVDLLPGDVVENQYYPWGNYNETDFWMGALGGSDSGKIHVLWNATRKPQACGYAAKFFKFDGGRAAIATGDTTITAASADRSDCPRAAVAALPAVSITFTKEGETLESRPYVPYASAYYSPDDFFPRLLAVSPSITPEDSELIMDVSIDDEKAWWKLKRSPSVDCPCGTYVTYVRLYHTNGTWSASVAVTADYNLIELHYGTYTMYTTGACALKQPEALQERIGGYGKTVKRDIRLDQPSGSKSRWIIIGAVAGAIVVFAVIVIAIVIVMRRRGQRVQYQTLN